MKVQVIEFVRPNGKQVSRTCFADDAFENKVKAIQDAGLRLTLENLGNGVSSLCLEKPGKGDVMCELGDYERWETDVLTILQDYTPGILADWEKEMGDSNA